jgi:hypothetical protein
VVLIREGRSCTIPRSGSVLHKQIFEQVIGNHFDFFKNERFFLGGGGKDIIDKDS